MKTLKTSLIALFVGATFLTSCSKDDDNPTPAPVAVVYPEQSPLQDFLVKTGFYQVTSPVKDRQTLGGQLVTMEYGYTFVPQVTGKINALMVKIPDVADIRVTIWDKSTKTAIRTEMIPVIANTLATKTITPLQLVKDKEYCISFNTNDSYWHEKTDKSAVTYPIVVGDIKITSYCVGSNSTQTFPDGVINTRYEGDVDFKFQRTE